MAKAPAKPPAKEAEKRGAKPSGEKQKPKREVVKAAGKGLKHAETVPPPTVRRMSGRILDDQKNDPLPHKPGKA